MDSTKHGQSALEKKKNAEKKKKCLRPESKTANNLFWHGAEGEKWEKHGES